MTELKDLPSITEEKLRELEKSCLDAEGHVASDNVALYYQAARNLQAAGYDARHHVASAYGLVKRLKSGGK